MSTEEKRKAYNIFISYSHRDQELCHELIDHLSNLKRQGLIAHWHDSDIVPTEEWKPELITQLDKADIILLLVSRSFMASDFIQSVELTRALERHEAKEARVLPIILRPVDWKDAPFAKLQALPTGAKPVVQWPSHDEAFVNIVKGLRRVITFLDEQAQAGS